MFLGLSEIEQEALAQIGDAHDVDRAIALGYAIADPKLADEGVSAVQGDTTAEESLAMRLAEGLAAKILDKRPAQTTGQAQSMPRETFAGFGEKRREELTTQPKPRLFGKEAEA